MRLYQRITGINKKRISKLIVVTILFLSVSSVFLNSSIVVYAWSAGGLRSTIASIIVSMLMSSGAGVTNMDWLNQLNTAYGVESSIGTLENAISQGLLTESAGTLIDTGLSDAIMESSAYTDLGLDALFSTTASDSAIQAGTIVASGGANIATESISTLTLGTVGQAFVAVGAGIGLGVLANHFINQFGKPMTNAAPINLDDATMDRLIAGGSYGYQKGRFNTTDLTSQCFASPGVQVVRAYNRNQTEDKNLVAVNTTNETKNILRYSFNSAGGNTPTTISISPHDIYSGAGDISNNYVNEIFPSSPIYTREQLSKIANGEIVINKYSPDVIGSDGNQTGTYTDENGYVFPNLNPYYNPQEKGLKPIPMDDYMDFAQDAIDNTENGDVEEIQGNLFDNFINPYLLEQEPVIPEPDPDYTDPNVIPEQPEYNPKTPVTAEDISDSDPYTTPDLLDRFPFCIPSDILSIFNKFKMNREAPVISWNFRYDAIGLDSDIEVDFSEYDSAASLLRTLELILFVVGLGVATRKLIGA